MKVGNNMRIRGLFICVILFMFVTIVEGQTNFYQQVSQLWLTGQKQSVLNIAQQRLQQNSNDIAGLLLKLEYEIEFLDLANITNTMTRVLTVGSTITSSNFVLEFPVIRADCGILTNQSILAGYTPQQIEQERQKASITNKPIGLGEVIKALQKDGYFR